MRMMAINLASAPFRRDRPFEVAALAGATVLAALLMLQAFTIYIRHQEAEQAREAVAAARGHVAAIATERARLENTLREPDNEEAFDYSIFLNGLLMRKGISWTRIFSDLGEVMPYDVRLVAVRPQVNLDNQVLLDMTVACKSVEPVIDMLKKIESSSHFGKTEMTTFLPPSQSEPLFRYRVTANYAPAD
jgi:hypothetical protein